MFSVWYPDASVLIQIINTLISNFKMNILITICARGGSKGIPGKNIKLINGKSLIAYSIDLTKEIQAKYNAKVALSTDDDSILTIARELGLHTNYKRPDFLATDTAGKIDTIRDLLMHEESLIDFKYDFILDLDVTSPLRNLEDIEKALQLMINNPDAKNLFSVNPAARNPYFNMVEEFVAAAPLNVIAVDTDMFAPGVDAAKVPDLAFASVTASATITPDKVAPVIVAVVFPS